MKIDTETRPLYERNYRNDLFRCYIAVSSTKLRECKIYANALEWSITGNIIQLELIEERAKAHPQNICRNIIQIGARTFTRNVISILVLLMQNFHSDFPLASEIMYHPHF